MKFEFRLLVDVKPTTLYAQINPIYQKELEKDLTSQIRRIFEDPDKAVVYDDYTPLRKVSVSGCTVTIYAITPISSAGEEE